MNFLEPLTFEFFMFAVGTGAIVAWIVAHLFIRWNHRKWPDK